MPFAAELDNLYIAYVDALAAQSNVELSQLTGAKIDVASLVPLDEALDTLKATRRTLATLLNLPLPELDRRGLFGRLVYKPEEEPPLSEQGLIQQALQCRPDLITQRMNTQRAEADIRLTLANRLDDIQVLYQPFTNSYGPPIGQRSSLSWTLGVTVPMPLYNRQQGNLRKARLILDQEKTRLVAMEHAAVAEVQAAIQEHQAAEKAVARTMDDLSKDSKFTYSLIPTNEDAKDAYKMKAGMVLERLRNDAHFDKIRKYGDAITRHRKSMLRINTAVGAFVMP